MRLDPVQTHRPASAPTSPVAAERLAGVRRPGTIDDPVVPAAELAMWAPRGRTTPLPADNTRVAAAGAARVAAQAPDRPPPDARTLALLSQDVYNNAATPPAGWRVAGKADLAALGIPKSMLDNPASGFRARIYAEGTGADACYVVAFRGSTTRGDWIANAQQAVGAESDHYRRALLIGERVSRASGVDVHFTGHSLGGGLASAGALAAGRDGTTFNAAGLHARTIDGAAQIRLAAGIGAAPDVHAFYVRGDILSALQDGGDRMVGALLGRVVGSLAGPVGGLVGELVGRQIDAPEAYGTRMALDAHRPDGKSWWQDNPVARHGMDWVLASLPPR